MANNFEDAEKAIKTAKSILVATHRDPDGDAIGSLLAVSFYLKKIGKPFYAFSVSGVPETLNLLPGAELIKDVLPRERHDLVLGLDYGSRDRLGLEDYFKKYRGLFLGFDHHPAAGPQPKIRILDVSSAACALMLFDYFKAIKFKLDKKIAKALMTGILTDTGFFKFARDSKSLEAAVDLMRFGITISEIDNALNANKKIEAVRLSGKILQRAAYNKKGDFNFTYVLIQDLKGLELEEIIGVVDKIRNIKKGKFALFLIEERVGTWRCRLRSRPDQRYNVAALARKFGGNGHEQAAGFRAKGKIDDILKTVAKYAQK